MGSYTVVHQYYFNVALYSDCIFLSGSGVCYFSALRRCCTTLRNGVRIDGTTSNVGLGVKTFDVNFFLTGGFGVADRGGIASYVYNLV